MKNERVFTLEQDDSGEEVIIRSEQKVKRPPTQVFTLSDEVVPEVEKKVVIPPPVKEKKTPRSKVVKEAKVELVQKEEPVVKPKKARGYFFNGFLITLSMLVMLALIFTAIADMISLTLPPLAIYLILGSGGFIFLVDVVAAIIISWRIKKNGHGPKLGKHEKVVLWLFNIIFIGVLVPTSVVYTKNQFDLDLLTKILLVVTGVVGVITLITDFIIVDKHHSFAQSPQGFSRFFWLYALNVVANTLFYFIAVGPLYGLVIPEVHIMAVQMSNVWAVYLWYVTFGLALVFNIILMIRAFDKKKNPRQGVTLLIFTLLLVAPFIIAFF